MGNLLLTAANVADPAGSSVSADISTIISNLGVWLKAWIGVIMDNPLIEIAVLLFLAGVGISFLKRLLTV